jgi:MFS-type transporter involved in bile tolerance (Atg22 family)
MEGILLWIGRIAGMAGLVLSVWAAVARLQGAYFAAGFQIGTLLLVGMTGMIIACLCLLFVLTMRPRQ